MVVVWLKRATKAAHEDVRDDRDDRETMARVAAAYTPVPQRPVARVSSKPKSVA
jgi:hypothetical protein